MIARGNRKTREAPLADFSHPVAVFGQAEGSRQSDCKQDAALKADLAGEKNATSNVA
jgi:hypothetical protein